MGDVGGAAGGAVHDLADPAHGTGGGPVSGPVAGAVDAAVSATGDALGGPGDTGGPAAAAVAGAVHEAADTVGGTVAHVVAATGGRRPQEPPHASQPAAVPVAREGSPPDKPEPRSATVDVVRPAARATDRAPANAPRRNSRQDDGAGQVPVSPAAAAAARRLILAFAGAAWWQRPVRVGPTESTDVDIPASFYDESCRSPSLAIADLRRCARASILIPQLGGPAPVWALLSLTMVVTGLVLMARRRRDAALGTPVG